MFTVDQIEVFYAHGKELSARVWKISLASGPEEEIAIAPARHIYIGVIRNVFAYC